MAETVEVPVDLLRSAASCLRGAGGVAEQAIAKRLTALIRAHDEPDLFAEPARAPNPASLPPISANRMPRMHGAATTQEMRRKAWPRTGTYRLAMLRTVAAAGDRGMTDYDLENVMGRSHQSVSATRNGLVADGWLEPAKHPNGTPVERRNDYGNMAQVWCTTDAARRRLAGG